MNRIKDMNEVLTGVFLILVALLAFYLARTLSSSTELGLGPGYVPKMFAAIQLVLGIVMIVNGCLQPGEPTEQWHLRPLVLILASVGFFAMTIERPGLVFIGCAANRETKFRESIALAAGSIVFSVLVFVKALGLQIMVLPPIPWGN